jgi:hypothetical protein
MLVALLVEPDEIATLGGLRLLSTADNPGPESEPRPAVLEAALHRLLATAAHLAAVARA